MKIMVFNVAAESGGALSVLHDFYDEYKYNQENEYIFIVSLPELNVTSNIEILRFPWIKKSWAHRFFFDNIIAPKLIKKYQVDMIVSLQNIAIPRTKVNQSIFLHNALPFSDYKFSLNESKILWIYQNIIGRRIKKSIRDEEHIIVQTKWMKKKIIEQIQVVPDKIEIKPPKIDIEVKKKFDNSKESLSTFFFPASAVVFKNHKIIIDACLGLKKEGIDNYNIIFTLYGNENENISRLYNIAKKNELPVKFIGSISREEVLNYYGKSILIFPSYIETVGLPLLEAKIHNTPIVVADLPYSREILDGYKGKVYFDYLNSEQLAEIMKEYLYYSREGDV